MNKIIEVARQKAIAAGVPAECVNTRPCEVDSTWCGEDIVVWGCTSWQASTMERADQAWFEQHPEVQLAEDVFTWKGLPRWAIWVSPEDQKAYSE
jgi:hypothetical protein